MSRTIRQPSRGRKMTMLDFDTELVHCYAEIERYMSPEEKALRDDALADMESDGWYGCDTRTDERDGKILLDWFSKSGITTYGVDARNPDWSFLDNWELHDAEMFYEAHAYLPIAYSLAQYIDARRVS